MQTQLINFTIPKKLLRKVDLTAQRELRSRSELLREAVRRYLDEQMLRTKDFARIRAAAKRINLDEDKAMELAEEAKAWARKQK